MTGHVTDKRRRAAAFDARPGPTPQTGRLDLRWASGFDRSCFLVSTEGLNARYHDAYQALMHDLRTSTGCSEAEILAHGRRVRSVIAFVERRLDRAGELAGLGRGKRYVYDLPAVEPRF